MLPLLCGPTPEDDALCGRHTPVHSRPPVDQIDFLEKITRCVSGLMASELDAPEVSGNFSGRDGFRSSKEKAISATLEARDFWKVRLPFQTVGRASDPLGL